MTRAPNGQAAKPWCASPALDAAGSKRCLRGETMCSLTGFWQSVGCATLSMQDGDVPATSVDTSALLMKFNTEQNRTS